MKQRILTQGHLDGFCLLYSIMNTYKSLINPSELATKFSFKARNRNKWNELIATTPSLHNFASGEGSVFGLKNETALEFERSFISSCFNIISDENKKLESTKINFNDVVLTDFATSSVIICFRSDTKLEHGDSGDHWVTIVGLSSEENKLLLACSYTSHEKGLTELKDNKTNKYYNNAVNLKDFKSSRVYAENIYRIKLYLSK